MIPATSCSAERSFSALCRLKTYLRSTMGQQRVSDIALINTERAYDNSVVNNDMDIVNNAWISSAVEMEQIAIDRFICKNIFASYVGHC